MVVASDGPPADGARGIIVGAWGVKIQRVLFHKLERYTRDKILEVLNIAREGTIGKGIGDKQGEQ